MIALNPKDRLIQSLRFALESIVDWIGEGDDETLFGPGDAEERGRLLVSVRSLTLVCLEQKEHA